jgi:aspartyl-tRNA(Asn)/glutamyl-tRNA(Gln) amidotransferase subunit A
MILDRLQLNLRSAGIAVDDDTIQAIVDKGFLQFPLLFDALVEQEPLDRVPDYLAAWGEPGATAATATQRTATAYPTAPEILALADELRRGALSPVELTEQALARIDQQDRELNAFQLVLVDRARAAARQAADEIRQGHYRGPLHGIPVAIKDLLDLAGTPTTAGSKLRAGQVAQENSAAVEKLEAAGAIIIGKTRMSEFAYAPSSFNPHYGPTHNPAAPQRDTGGSSSG